MKSRFLATGIHYISTFIVIGCLVLTCIYFWYPGALFLYAGGFQGIKLTFYFIALPLPILTLIIYKPNKKGLKFDLTTIAIFQSSLFAFASYTLYMERPTLLIIAENIIYPLSTREANVLDYHYDSSSEINWVYVDLPLNKGQVNAIKFASELVDSKGLASRSDLYIPFTKATISSKKFNNYLNFFTNSTIECVELYILFNSTKTPVCLNKKSLHLEPNY